MNKLLSLCVAFMLALVTADVLSVPAHTCNGQPLVWSSDTLNFKVPSRHYPQDSIQYHNLNLALSHFNRNPSNFRISTSYEARTRKNTGMNGNGVNEILFSSLDGDAIGRELKIFSCSEGLIESDVILATAPDWTTSSSALRYLEYGGDHENAVGVLLHEFGHAAGVGHTVDSMSNMGSAHYFYRNGSTIYEGVGEDLSVSLRSLYGNGESSKQDLAVSHYRYVGNDGEYALVGFTRILEGGTEPFSVISGGMPVYHLVRGEAYDLEFTYENMGQNSAFVSVEFYLSSNNYISPGDRLIARFEGLHIGPNIVFTKKYNITLPMNAHGRMHLGVIVNREMAEINGSKESTLANNRTFHQILVVDE